ncbi:alpha/beta hydrolase [Actinomadura spongiicola]|uniref:Alpha/beta hydrolase n=1 Tax=Actinomadura spongiicola TaxID=2303421 RepID=A0A372GDW4_9ACTN|nr:alpha/beta hydrolase fold domain-containing protein [Actinomadura spongiicola]RFS83564.1 alpha/beta hydrolase [Actinomadura spongiicola]
MSEITTVKRPPEPDWPAMTDEELLAYREAENRFRASSAARALLGEPDPGATIEWQRLVLPDREIPVRVYRPAAARDGDGTDRAELPLVLHGHGGSFVGTAVQCDWANSHLAARLPALVGSVEHRLIGPETPLSDAVDDGWDVLRHMVRHASQRGIDPARTAVFGESCGALISALAAIGAREAGLTLKAQVLVNPAVDVTETMFDYASIAEFRYSPTRAVPQLRVFQRLSVPQRTDARALSPLYADDLSGLAPALVVVPTRDAVVRAQRKRRVDRAARQGHLRRDRAAAGAGVVRDGSLPGSLHGGRVPVEATTGFGEGARAPQCARRGPHGPRLDVPDPRRQGSRLPHAMGEKQ